MQLFLVWRWETQDSHPKTTGGLYAVRAANREDCAQLLLRREQRTTPELATMQELQHIRKSVATAITQNLQGKFKYEKIVDAFEQHWSHFI